jgi:NAD-dependent dihydropyrimidine dehydrogenase PreA subunit
MLATIMLALGAGLLVLVLVLWLFGERWRLLRRSTRRMMREGRIGLDALHGYIYGRWTNQYVKLLIRGLPFLRTRPGSDWAKRLSEHYHGKVLTEEQAEAIVSAKKDIPLRDLEQIIPYSTARNLVLHGPPDVAVYECACRHARARPCAPTLVCMVIGQPFVDFILEHNPHSSRRLTQAEALELLRQEHERGHMHSAWFKDAMLNRFYAICNCCKCCCGGIEAMTKYGAPLLASSGYVAALDRDLCNQCGVCVDACPFNALSTNEAGVERSWEKCMGCGVCVEKCPTQAMALARDEKKGIPLDVRLFA